MREREQDGQRREGRNNMLYIVCFLFCVYIW